MTLKELSFSMKMGGRNEAKKISGVITITGYRQ